MGLFTFRRKKEDVAMPVSAAEPLPERLSDPFDNPPVAPVEPVPPVQPAPPVAPAEPAPAAQPENPSQGVLVKPVPKLMPEPSLPRPAPQTSPVDSSMVEPPATPQPDPFQPAPVDASPAAVQAAPDIMQPAGPDDGQEQPSPDHHDPWNQEFSHEEVLPTGSGEPLTFIEQPSPEQSSGVSAEPAVTGGFSDVPAADAEQSFTAPQMEAPRPAPEEFAPFVEPGPAMQPSPQPAPQPSVPPAFVEPVFEGSVEQPSERPGPVVRRKTEVFVEKKEYQEALLAIVEVQHGLQLASDRLGRVLDDEAIVTSRVDDWHVILNGVQENLIAIDMRMFEEGDTNG